MIHVVMTCVGKPFRGCRKTIGSSCARLLLDTTILCNTQMCVYAVALATLAFNPLAFLIKARELGEVSLDVGP